MNITVMIPSRHRLKALKRMLLSLTNNTSDKAKVNVLVTCDNDDLKTEEMAYSVNSGLRVSAKVKARSKNLNNDYYNMMAADAFGRSADVAWALGDDCEVLTPGWDEKVRATLTGRENKAWYIGCEDGTPEPKHIKIQAPPFSCFPMLTKAAWQATGWFFWPHIPSWGADFALHALWSTVGRMISLPEVKVAHHCHHNGSAVRDLVNCEIEVAHKQAWKTGGRLLPGQANAAAQVVINKLGAYGN